MVDIRLITILPTTQVPTVQQPQLQGGGGATILASLPTGSILSGFIVNRDPAGNPVLRTESGDVVFATNFFLKIGSEVTIRVENRAGNANAHILSVNGSTPEVAETQSAFAGEPEVIVGQQAPKTVTANATTPAALNTVRADNTITVSATLLTPVPATTQSPAVPAGATLALKITSIASNDVPAAPSQVTAQPVTPVIPQQTTAVPASTSYATYAKNSPPAPTVPNAVPSTATQTPQTLFNTATPYRPTVSEPLLMATPTPTAPASPTAQPVTQPAATALPVAPAPQVPPAIAPQVGQVASAVVLSNEPTGEAVLQTPYGIVRLQPGTMLPVGSKVTFEIMEVLASQANAVNPLPLAPLTQLATRWQSLQDIFTLLVGSDTTAAEPQAGLPLLLSHNAFQPQQSLPQALGAGLMVFMSALRGGDFRNWLGKDNIDWLEKNGHEMLVKRAEGEFIAIARPFVETQPNQWQSLFFPFVANGELQQARLFTKRDKEKKSGQDNKKGEDTRFVVEVDLSQLGEMQMDGFVRKREQAVEFDLFIRSHTALSSDVQQDILAIYNSTGKITGYKGSVVFQAVKDFPVHPMDELALEHLHGVIA